MGDGRFAELVKFSATISGTMETIQVTAQNFTPRVQRWLQKPKAVTLLHLFDQVINLIDADGEIISVVQPQIQAGPFSIVVDEERPFPHLISPHDTVSKTATSLTIGPLAIDCRQAKLWQPIPHWQLLRENQSNWQKILPSMQTAVTNHLEFLGEIGPANFHEQFQAAIEEIQTLRLKAPPDKWQTAVTKLAGFGPGFTPAGDDFLLGFLFGLWATRPKNAVMNVAKIVVETAVPRTTQLSAAWLQAAAQGEAALPWHHLANALLENDEWETTTETILNTGATSGIAALMGFLAGTTRELA